MKLDTGMSERHACPHDFRVELWETRQNPLMFPL